MQCDIGVVGLGVMGSNLALNMERNGFRVAGYDLDAAKGRAFVGGPAAGKNVELAQSPDGLMALLKKPRRVLMMVPAGPPVDSAIAHLKAHLEPGDILIDGGNSWFLDTERRSKALAAEGFNYVGTGVSGGEEGALWGPSIMPGGPGGGLGGAGADPARDRGEGRGRRAVRRAHGPGRRRATT